MNDLIFTPPSSDDDQDHSLQSVHILVTGELCPLGRPEKFLRGSNAIAFWDEVIQVTTDHDFCITNLECPLTERHTPVNKIGPTFRADPECAIGIRNGGFDLVSLANNHIFDMGKHGIERTLQACRDADLSTVGAGIDITQAAKPFIVTIKGIRIAILAYAEAEFSTATLTSAGACPLDEVDNYYQIRSAHERSDFVLVILHGGNEYYSLPSPRLQKVCRYFADLGAGAIVCHHSHVSSGFEVINGVPIFYGTGNFLFDWPKRRTASWYKGYMVSLSIKKDQVNRFELIPYEQCKDKVGVQLLLTETAKESFFEEIKQLNSVIADQQSLDHHWQSFCSNKQFQYLGAVFAGNAFTKLMWRRRWMNRKRLGRRRLIALNLIRCQAHRDVLIAALNDDAEG